MLALVSAVLLYVGMQVSAAETLHSTAETLRSASERLPGGPNRGLPLGGAETALATTTVGPGGVILALIGLSIYVVATATKDDIPGQPGYYMNRQITFAAVGTVLMLAISQVLLN